MKGIAAAGRSLCLLFVFQLLLEPVTSAASTPTPNIVIILVDDLGWNDVGYHGSEIRTPRIDRLAAEGIVLDRFYAQPTCSPARAALMTGKSPMRLGILGPLSKHSETGLPLNEKIMPQYLREQGYQTYLVGKWHLGFRQRAYLPYSRGFDHFYGHIGGGVGYWDHVHGGAIDWQRNGKTVYDEGYATDLQTDEAIELIRGRDSSRPMFLYFSPNAVHLPNEAPEEEIQAYSFITDRNRRVHAAMTSHLDSSIGQLLDVLAEEEILDNTLIWFMSDNGGLNPGVYPKSYREKFDRWARLFGKPLPLDYYEFRRSNVQEGGSDNAPLRGGKGGVYEGGTRVPSILFWRGTLRPSKLTQMVTIQDVLPTILAVTGNAERADDADFDGGNMWPSISRGQQVPTPHYITHSRFAEAVHQYPWKLVRLKSGQSELYRVDDDPNEALDLADSNPGKVSTLLAYLDGFPRGESVRPSFWKVLWDAESFGGDVDREPWTEIVR